MLRNPFSEGVFKLKAKNKLAGKIVPLRGISEDNFPVRSSMLGTVPQGKVILSPDVALFLDTIDELTKEMGREIPFLLFGKTQGQIVYVDNYVADGLSESMSTNFSSNINVALQKFINSSKKDGTDIVVHGHSHPKIGSYYNNFSLGDMEAYTEFRESNEVFNSNKIWLSSCLVVDGNFNFLFYDGNDYYKFNEVYEETQNGNYKRLKCYSKPDVVVSRDREY